MMAAAWAGVLLACGAAARAQDAAPAPGAEQVVPLTMKMEAGPELAYTIVHTIENVGASPALQDGKLDQKLQQELRVKVRVVKSEPTGATVAVRLERIRMRSQSVALDMDFGFDSAWSADNDAGNPMAEALRPLVGGEFTLTIGPDGMIQAVIPPDREIPRGMMSGIAQGLVKPELVSYVMQPMFGVREGSQTGKAGESWSLVSMDHQAPGVVLRREVGVKFESVEGSTAVLALSGQTKSLAPEGVAKATSSIAQSTIVGSARWDGAVSRLARWECTETNLVVGDPDSPQPLELTSTMTTLIMPTAP